MILSLVSAAGILVLLAVRLGLNPQALIGAQGLMAGPVQRYDERDIVFASNRSLRPETDQYKIYYKLIRALITRNRYSRRLFNLMDDIFYGKKPKPKRAPEWAAYD